MALAMEAMFEQFIKHSRKVIFSAWSDGQRTPGSWVMPHSLKGTSMSVFIEVKQVSNGKIGSQLKV